MRAGNARAAWRLKTPGATPYCRITSIPLSIGKSESGAENPTGEPGKGGMATEGTGTSYARDLGQGWKVAPSVVIEPGQTYTQADIEGPGAIQSMWLSGDVAQKGPLARFYILRIYWDDQKTPSVECPSADFFASGWGQFTQVNSVPVSVNPDRARRARELKGAPWPRPRSDGVLEDWTTLHDGCIMAATALGRVCNLSSPLGSRTEGWGTSS